MSKTIIVLSGGLDSSVLLARAVSLHKKEDVYTITYFYGQKHKNELEMAMAQAAHWGLPQQNVKLIDISFYKDLAPTSALTNDSIAMPNIKDVCGDPQPSSYCPNRNMIMLSMAAALAEGVGASKVEYGAQAADTFSGYWDASPEFLPSINDVLALNRRNFIQVEAPFMNTSKSEIILMGDRLGVDFTKTITCYNGGPVGCGVCPACSNRIKAFIDVKLKDPIPYKMQIDWEKYGCK